MLNLHCFWGLLPSCAVWVSHCGGFFCCGVRALGPTGFTGCSVWLQSTGSVAVLQGLSCPSASGVFPGQGSNPRLLQWQMDSLPLSHQGSPAQSLNHWTIREVPIPIQSLSPIKVDNYGDNQSFQMYLMLLPFT